MKLIMNPDHPMWSDFVRNMGCPSKCEHFAGTCPACHGDTLHTRILLELYPNTDVDGSLEYFRWWGARCDCSVWDEVCKRLGPNFKELERIRLQKTRKRSFLKDLIGFFRKKLCVRYP